MTFCLCDKYQNLFCICSIAKEHAVVSNKNGTVTLKPGAEAKGILVNGAKITKDTQLSHNDRYEGLHKYLLNILSFK